MSHGVHLFLDILAVGLVCLSTRFQRLNRRLSVGSTARSEGGSNRHVNALLVSESRSILHPLRVRTLPARAVSPSS